MDATVKTPTVHDYHKMSDKEYRAEVKHIRQNMRHDNMNAWRDEKWAQQ